LFIFRKFAVNQLLPIELPAKRLTNEIRESFFIQHFGRLEERIARDTDNAHFSQAEVLVFAPTQRRPFFTLVTNGISDRVPPANSKLAREFWRLEIMMCVEDLEEEVDWDNSWACHFLKAFSILPHQMNIPLVPGLIVPNGAPPEPIMAGSNLMAAVFLHPYFEGRPIREGIITPSGDSINILALDFISAKEKQFYEEKGLEEFGNLLAKNNHRRCVDPLRSSYL
jgi:Suppressor of fused protein (SUFU)